MRNALFIFLFLISICSYAKSQEFNILSDDETQFLLKKYIDTKEMWHGIYAIDGLGGGFKIGYSHIWIETQDSFNDYNKPVVIENQKMVIDTLTDGEALNFEVNNKQVFQAEPPYNLLYDYVDENYPEASLITTTSVREENHINIFYNDGISERTKVIENFDYRLNHYLNHMAFFLPDQNYVGNTYKSIEFQEGKFVEFTYSFMENKKKMIQGIPYEYYVYDFYMNDDVPLSGKILVNPQNNQYLSFLYKEPGMEYRLEDREIAQNLDNKQDLFLAHEIPLDRDYLKVIEEYSHTKFKNIFIEIQGDYKNQFPNAYQQHVIEVDNSKYLVLSNFLSDTMYGVAEEASQEDINKNLEKKDFDPIDDPQIISLAKEGINGATEINDQIINLLSFVSDYIKDDLISTEWSSVYQIIENKSGDCTEHALLFNVLARSIGIPSREVVGYVYDHTSQSFVGHAWNEVAAKGFWFPADPTWNLFGLTGMHIKESEELTKLISNIKFRLAALEFQNGEEIVF